MSWCANGGQPGRGEARDDAAAARSGARAAPWPTRMLRPAAVRGRVGLEPAAVEVGDHPARDGEPHRDHVRLARAVVDQDQPRSHRPPRARSPSRRACRRRGGRARSRRSSEPAGSVPRPVSTVGSRRRGAGRPACRPCRRSSRRRRASGRAEPHAGGGALRQRARRRGCRGSAAGASGATTSSAGAEDVVVRERRRRRSRRARCPASRPSRARSRRGRSRPRSPRRRPPRSRCGPPRSSRRWRVGLGAAAGEVDHVHPVGDRRLEGRDDLGRVGDVADRRRRVEDAVVADPRARRDAGEPGRRRDGPARRARSCPRRRRRSRRRACRGTTSSGSTASPLALSSIAPTNERATITFGVVHFVPPFGKPGG